MVIKTTKQTIYGIWYKVKGWLLLCLLFCSILSVIISCEITSLKNGGNINAAETPLVNKAINVVSQTPLNYESEEKLLLDVLDERALLSSLPSLRKKRFARNEVEVRIWIGFGQGITRGVVLKHQGKTGKAIYLPPLMGALTKENHTILKDDPKSGWEHLWNKLIANDILALPEEPNIGEVEPFIDSEVVIIETQNGSKYHNFSYGEPCYSKAKQAEQILKILQILKEELAVDLYHCE